MYKRLMSSYKSYPKFEFLKKPPNLSRFKQTNLSVFSFSIRMIPKYLILGLGFYAYLKGTETFARIATDYKLHKEVYENQIRSNSDIDNCMDVIKNFKVTEEYYKRRSNPDYNPLHIENLMIHLKERKAICLKGNYGSGTTEYAFAVADKWIQDGNHIIYYKPHSRLQVTSRISELLKILNTKDEDSFLKALKEFKKDKKEILLVVDDLDCIDTNHTDSYKFLNYLKNLQEENYLHTLYVFRTNLLERFITGLYKNDISLIFVGGNKFPELQTDKEKEYVSTFCNIKEELAQKFLFFFGMNYKNMKEYNDFVKYNQETNNDLKTVEDFIDAKIDKVMDSTDLKGQTNDVLNLCRTIDSNGIFHSDWKKHLSIAQRSSLENNDILMISGTTTALTRAAIAKLCDKSWKAWDLTKWKGKWNVEYYL